MSGYQPAEVPCAVATLSGFRRRASQERDKLAASQGIGVSPLRHQPFGYQRLTATLAL